MTEHDYELWFDMHLGDIESPYSTVSELSPIKNVPKPVKRKNWFIGLFVSLMICTFSSMIFSYLYAKYDLWYFDWISNALSNFSIGIISSILILIYTNTIEKNNSFYSDIIPLLENRYSKMSSAYSNCNFYPKIKYDENDMQGCFDEWHKLVNTCTVILNFIIFLLNSSGEYGKRLNIEIGTVKKYLEELHVADNKICEEFYKTNEISCESLEKCLDVSHYGNIGLSLIENMIIKMNQELYRNKYAPK